MSSKRSGRSKSARRKVKINLWYDNGQRRCHCCCVQLNWTGNYKNSATIEHMIPKSRGGTLEAINILIMCYRCNAARGNIDWIEWITTSKPPKAEWLIQKYLDAVQFYRKQRIPIHRSIIQDSTQYLK